jgi:hypothetical protein
VGARTLPAFLRNRCLTAPGPRSGSAAGPAHCSVAYNGCTQEDAPALMIRLESSADDAAPVEIEISGAEGASLPVRITLSPLRRESTGSRIFARAAHLGDAEPVFLSGEVVLTALEKGRRVAGIYKLRVPDGAEAAGAFDAEWHADRVVCGG